MVSQVGISKLDYLTNLVVCLTDGKKIGDMDGYVGFHAALRCSYNCFIRDLAKQCKQLVRHHLDSVTSPYSQVCYDSDLLFSSGANSNRYQASTTSVCLDLSDHGSSLCNADQENIAPENNNNSRETTPGKLLKAAGEASMTVPETPSPDQPCDRNYVIKTEHGNFIEGGARKRQNRMHNNKVLGNIVSHNGCSLLFAGGDAGSRSGSTYTEICLSAAQHFARIREVLVERSVSSALNSGFLTPWYGTNAFSLIKLLYMVLKFHIH